jgi:hypothetical protein
MLSQEFPVIHPRLPPVLVPYTTSTHAMKGTPAVPHRKTLHSPEGLRPGLSTPQTNGPGKLVTLRPVAAAKFNTRDMHMSISDAESACSAAINCDSIDSGSPSNWLVISVILVNGWHELFELHSCRCNIDLI